MKISKGIEEQGIPVGNYYDKYNTQNPIARKMMSNFDHHLSQLVDMVTPKSIHEIGCGEGVWALKWHQQGIRVKGSDFSQQVIQLARDNAQAHNLEDILFEQKSVYDVARETDSADLVVCCEVLEHLEHPEQALATLQDLDTDYYIFSVPREPLWCALNMARGKYLNSWGNTPGHIQHWSKNAFLTLLNQHFEILEVRSPIPWTMVLCQRVNHET
ncbi:MULTISPECIES: class I SAM-dependent methyltransferase [Vibrio]|uniref:2-polyprenyl-3-methyl-5-hydroxy-6-metoxy-1, 4-benzoquinol methylase n=2 Tax=Vibrio antiquarius (strain Ex25) TaxID=150340 RepID=A0ACA6QT88_VIBAE|nr:MULTISPECIES: class I SAM-dependent methyltransferase [Vibrio]RCW25166.1 methyltransferase family protein [Vibrio parahaemolyticus]ACY53740.1 2-polyprenyl-3-methyl-5-hydroxy-6-metoxy-1,4-benzoquinol methylase [Vibrio antiquarius]EDN58821.1 2-polyprenyl-3-methyl-5-hydroxy-6-metoxy-1,4-benzoquinol methylase [Vibrio antiquarius]MCG6221580.1 class I SAM-dependent methyltransferase [Vibrio diabolicus]MCG9619627.1 class I SAM-dependent methyltransferase [Vibrio diabolicus]